MLYSFDTILAKKYGVDEAIMLHNFQFWIRKNKFNNKNKYPIEIEGQTQLRTFTYNSVEAMTKWFDFWSTKQIRRILQSLIKQKVLVTGNYNTTPYNRTLWYAFYNESEFLDIEQDEQETFTETDESILPNGKMKFTDQENQVSEMEKTYTYSKPDKKTNKKTDNIILPLFDKWNEKKELVKHGITTVNRNFKKKHFDIINEYGLEEILQAINNYAAVLKNENQYYSHKFTLWRFIEKVDDFVDSARPLENWINDNSQTKEQKDFNDYLDRLEAEELRELENAKGQVY